MSEPHECRESKTCMCSLTALEPNESCPVHGWGEYPPRCCECGRFLKRERSMGYTLYDLPSGNLVNPQEQIGSPLAAGDKAVEVTPQSLNPVALGRQHSED